MPTTEVDDALGRAAAVIAAAPEVALACHVNPDGDALGSMLALHLALRAAGRRSVASFPEPFVVADHYRDLAGLDTLTEPATFPEAPAVMVTFDAGSIDRLGGLAAAAGRATELIVVDHHVSNTRFGTINVIDPTAAAKRLIAKFDRDADERLSNAEAMASLLPDRWTKLDVNRDAHLDFEELKAGLNRAADQLPNLAIPEMNGVGAMELPVSQLIMVIIGFNVAANVTPCLDQTR